MNPYDWKRNQPAIEVQRPEAGPVAGELKRGGSGVLLAGRGMGKSVFLQQVQRELDGIPGVRAVLIEEPPADLSVRACLEALARSLGVDVPGALAAREVVDAYRGRGGASENLVLLFDELDRYAKTNGTAEPPGRHYFNSLESLRRNLPGVGILAAGSIGVFAFRDVLGSSFLARADKVRIRPFDRAAISALARPFDERGVPLPEASVEALYLASGGNPALVTYGLGALWDAEAPSEHAVAEAFVRFRSQNREFLRDFQLAFADPGLSQAPQKVWDLIRQHDGSVARADLDQACGPSDSPLRLDVTDVLDILEAAGLVRVTGSMQVDPVLVRPVTSLLSLPSISSPSSPTRQRLVRDLEILLGRLHAASADFFRPGSDGQGKRLVPESVFAAFLGLGLQLLGWQVEREALQVAGRTDIKLRWNGSAEVAVVEVKIWGRPGYKDVLRQIAGYWSADTVAGAVVMLTDAEIDDWPKRYRLECLQPEDLPTEAIREADLTGGMRWRSTSTPQQAAAVDVDHLLLRLPRGR
jgi:hypothetical protein